MVTRGMDGHAHGHSSFVLAGFHLPCPASGRRVPVQFSIAIIQYAMPYSIWRWNLLLPGPPAPAPLSSTSSLSSSSRQVQVCLSNLQNFFEILLTFFCFWWLSVVCGGHFCSSNLACGTFSVATKCAVVACFTHALELAVCCACHRLMLSPVGVSTTTAPAPTLNPPPTRQ